MITSLIAFFGGSVFRMLWGEVSHWFTAKEEHTREIDRMKLQETIDAAQHSRTVETITVQAQLGIKTIQVQAEAAVSEIETQGWLEVVKGTTKKVGIVWVDAWNAVIRPGIATWAIIMMTLSEFKYISLSEFSASVAAAALGIYLADRGLSKRGK